MNTKWTSGGMLQSETTERNPGELDKDFGSRHLEDVFARVENEPADPGTSISTKWVSGGTTAGPFSTVVAGDDWRGKHSAVVQRRLSDNPAD